MELKARQTEEREGDSERRPVRCRGIRSLPWLLLLGVVTGVLLRLHQLDLQVIADDEWHSLHAASSLNLVQIASDFGTADRCIPLSVAYHLAANHLGLNEWRMRLLPLAAGIAILFAPLLLRPALNRAAAAGAVWLMAVSPLLVYFSRYARPYSISLLLSCLALIGFYRWWSGGRRGWIALFAAAAPLAIYFHLSVAFFALAPLAYALFVGRPGSGQGRSWRQTAPWAAATMGLTALLVAPPLLFRRGSVLGKLSEDGINGRTIDGAIELMAGSSYAWFALPLAILAIQGAGRFLRTFPRASAFVSLACAAQVLGVLLLAPDGLDIPIILVRYLLPLLPIGLVCAARGLSDLEARLQARMRVLPSGALSLLLAATAFWAGPLSFSYYYPNSWTNHGLFTYAYDLLDSRFSYYRGTLPKRTSDFYRQLADEPPSSLLLLEAPWHYEWHYNHLPHYQYVHRQRTMIGFVDESKGEPRMGELRLGDERFQFSHFAHLGDREAIRRKGVDFVVLHKDLSGESHAQAPRIEMSGWIARYRQWHGTPYFEDEQLVVFRLTGGEPSSALDQGAR